MFGVVCKELPTQSHDLRYACICDSVMDGSMCPASSDESAPPQARKML